MLKVLLLVVLTTFANLAFAEVELKVTQLKENVYALVGELSQRSEDNFGNNSTHGVIVTDEGVILIDAGGSYLGAQQIHKSIQTFTDKPVKIVINTGGQDHRWFGNDYFRKLGAIIVSSAKTQLDQKVRADSQMQRLKGLIGDSLKGTKPVISSDVFDSKKTIELGNVKLELYHFGSAHTAGDLMVWMPSKKIMFTGDIVFNNRMLGIGPAENLQSWITVFEHMENFKSELIVPGHGDPSDLVTARKNTYSYLVHLKTQISKVLEGGGDMQDALKIDQSQYDYLLNHETISGRNAQSVFEQLEFDF